jgi:hypothetical protein
MPVIRALAACALVVGCAANPPGADELYGPSISTIKIEVAYVSNAAPYVGPIPTFGKDAWRLMEVNLEGSSSMPGLFTGLNKTFVLPKTLAEFELVASAPGSTFSDNGAMATSYTVSQIQAIAAANRKQPGSGTASFYVLFLDGYYNDGTGPDTSVLGASIGSTRIIAMFKPVIVASADPMHPFQERFVEQAVLIHELGHAAGLVNNGIAMAKAHEDTTHRLHCTNPACAMFWLNDGGAGARLFVQRYITTGEDVLYGSECLADAAKAAGH